MTLPPRQRFAPELSARGIDAAPNPVLRSALRALEAELGPTPWRLTDQGCGRLRHLALLRPLGQVYCVDTRERLHRRTHLGGRETTVSAYLSQLDGSPVQAIDSEAFAHANLGLDLIVNVATLDIVPPEERWGILRSAARNLRRGGILLAIVPRGNEWIREKHPAAQPYADGFSFRDGGAWHFFRQFHEPDEVSELLAAQGFTVLRERSTAQEFIFSAVAGEPLKPPLAAPRIL